MSDMKQLKVTRGAVHVFFMALAASRPKSVEAMYASLEVRKTLRAAVNGHSPVNIDGIEIIEVPELIDGAKERAVEMSAGAYQHLKKEFENAYKAGSYGGIVVPFLVEGHEALEGVKNVGETA